MEYILVLFSVLSSTLQFIINKFYEKKYARATSDFFMYPAVNALFSVLFVFVLNRFRLEFGTFTVIIASIEAALFWVISITTVLAVRFGKMSVFTMFMMLGTILLPFTFGVVFLQETLSAKNISGLALMLAALIIPVVLEKKPSSLSKDTKNAKNRPLFYLLCIVIFIFNGAAAALSKFHQINEAALNTNDFLLWAYLMLFVISSLVYALYIIYKRVKRAKECGADLTKTDENAALPVIEKRSLRTGAEAVFFIMMTSVAAGITFLLQLSAAKSVPATVLYPVFSGLAIITVTLAGRIIYKEKISGLMGLSIILIIAGAILFFI